MGFLGGILLKYVVPVLAGLALVLGVKAKWKGEARRELQDKQRRQIHDATTRKLERDRAVNSTSGGDLDDRVRDTQSRLGSVLRPD
jgi:hypothetical protein